MDAIAAAVITGLNILGVKLANSAQAFVVVFLLTIKLMPDVGSFTGGMNGLFAALVMAPFLFVGFDVIPSLSMQ